jgi:hypothetical protein
MNVQVRSGRCPHVVTMVSGDWGGAVTGRFDGAESASHGGEVACVMLSSVVAISVKMAVTVLPTLIRDSDVLMVVVRKFVSFNAVTAACSDRILSIAMSFSAVASSTDVWIPEEGTGEERVVWVNPWCARVERCAVDSAVTAAMHAASSGHETVATGLESHPLRSRS